MSPAMARGIASKAMAAIKIALNKDTIRAGRGSVLGCFFDTEKRVAGDATRSGDLYSD